MINAQHIGIDFGTTNSSVARVDASGRGGTRPVSDCRRVSPILIARCSTSSRSWSGHRKTVKSWTGPEGIEQYLLAENKGRLIQSLKSFLSAAGVCKARKYSAGAKRSKTLIARILKDLREKAGRQFGIEIRHAVVGRPVHFVGAEDEAGDD